MNTTHILFVPISALIEILQNYYRLTDSTVFKKLSAGDHVEFRFYLPDKFISDHQVLRHTNLQITMCITDIIHHYDDAGQYIKDVTLKF